MPLPRLIFFFLLVGSISALLIGCAPEEEPFPEPSSSSSDARVLNAVELYEANCARCHLATGAGVDEQYPSLQRSKLVRGAKSWIVRTVLHGLNEPVRGSGEGYDAQMPSHWHLSDSTVARITTYVRTQFGENASAITAEEVEYVRNAYPTRQSPWTRDELRADSLVLPEGASR